MVMKTTNPWTRPGRAKFSSFGVFFVEMGAFRGEKVPSHVIFCPRGDDGKNFMKKKTSMFCKIYLVGG